MQKERPRLLIIAGPNGSGKTSVTNVILKNKWAEDCVYINPDNIARDMFGDWNDKKTVLKAAKYATNMRETCIANGQSLIFETVLSADDKISFIEKAKAKGYFIRLFFIGTNNPKINAERVANRVMRGGHDVPMQKITSRYYKSIANCSVLVPVVDRLYVCDNSVEYAPPKLLFRTSNGILTKQYTNINAWARRIFETTLKGHITFNL
ncbi:MAG: zeta toxin family protein [Bacteroidetes bacterium]|nr:zeta toxin family protein [Bacteroidota bacterium]